MWVWSLNREPPAAQAWQCIPPVPWLILCDTANLFSGRSSSHDFSLSVYPHCLDGLVQTLGTFIIFLIILTKTLTKAPLGTVYSDSHFESPVQSTMSGMSWWEKHEAAGQPHPVRKQNVMSTGLSLLSLFYIHLGAPSYGIVPFPLGMVFQF